MFVLRNVLCFDKKTYKFNESRKTRLPESFKCTHGMECHVPYLQHDIQIKQHYYTCITVTSRHGRDITPDVESYVKLILKAAPNKHFFSEHCIVDGIIRYPGELFDNKDCCTKCTCTEPFDNVGKGVVSCFECDRSGPCCSGRYKKPCCEDIPAIHYWSNSWNDISYPSKIMLTDNNWWRNISLHRRD